MDTLPRQLQSLLDDATSEAKRCGHGRVTPAHLLLALKRNRPDDATVEGLTSKAEAFLGSQQRSYDTPTVDDETTALLDAAAQSQDPVAGVVASVAAFLDAHPARTPAPTGATDRPPASGTATETTGEARIDASPSPVEERVDPLAEVGISLPAWVSGAVELVSAEAPVVPRTDVARRLTGLLRARTPQIPLLVAMEGQGRSSIARCLAAFLASSDAPAPLAGMPVVRVKAEPLLARNRESGLDAVLTACRGKAVVMVDDLEVLCSLGWPGGLQGGVLSVLRASLHDPDERVVLCVAGEFVDRLQAVDVELFDEVERIDLPPLSDEEVHAIAAHEASVLAEYHGVTIGDDVIAASLAPARQIDSRAQPALSVHRLDRAAAAATMREDRAAQIEDLGPAVAAQQYVSFDGAAARSRLSQTIVGQEEALDAVTRRLAVTRAALDMKPERPDGVFLFAGPTGTGKTALALALTQELFGTQEAIIRLDMSEFSEPHTVSKLVGSPPGYVGSTEPESWLTTKIRRRPQSVLLLDEIEKAHPQVWNTFLQVFDAGRLTDSQGRIADFRDVVVVLTTNIGADVFDQHQGPGFVAAQDNAAADRRAVMERLKTWMRPELLNRLDEVLVFRPLDAAAVREIAERRLAEVLRIVAMRGWSISAGADLVDLLVDRGYSPEYGARPLIRAMESILLEPVSMLPPGRYNAVVRDGVVVLDPAVR